MVGWTNNKIYINDTLQVSLGKLVLVLFISFFQFFGLWVDNNWILCPSMFYLFSNALLALDKSTKKRDEERQKLIAEKNELFDRNQRLFNILERDLQESKILITELRQEVKDLKTEIVDLKEEIRELKLKIKD